MPFETKITYSTTNGTQEVEVAAHRNASQVSNYLYDYAISRWWRIPGQPAIPDKNQVVSEFFRRMQGTYDYELHNLSDVPSEDASDIIELTPEETNLLLATLRLARLNITSGMCQEAGVTFNANGIMRIHMELQNLEKKFED